MRRIPIATLVFCALGAAAAAQDDHDVAWKEYVFAELGIAKEFPSDPHKESVEYRSETIGAALPAVSHYADHGETFFRLTAVDLRAPEHQAKLGEIVGECISQAEKEGRALRMQVIRAEDGTATGVRGRVASIDLDWNLGFRQTGCFYSRGRLYRVEATMVHPSDEDAELLAHFVTTQRFDVGN